MKDEEFLQALRSVIAMPLPLPGRGETPLRHRRLMEIGRENLSLARLAEAHWDAVAILAEAGRLVHVGALYGVWASEKPGQPLRLDIVGQRRTVSGSKMFCSGAGVVDRALVTVGTAEPLLIDMDLRADAGTLEFDYSEWKTDAFGETRTATTTFNSTVVSAEDIVGGPGWYLERPGFWHGACGPAACWAGGAAGLVDYAHRQSRNDPHTLAHFGAMQASVWAMQSYLDAAGREIDENPNDSAGARILARTVRHLVEQACTDVVRRLPRAYGPHPLAMDEAISQRYKEVDLYVRQWHAERDLEALGRDCKQLNLLSRA